MKYEPVLHPKAEQWEPTRETVLCPACQGTGWISGTLNEKTKPCLDQECIDGKGCVPENYVAPK